MRTELSALIKEHAGNNKPFVFYRKPNSSFLNFLVQHDMTLHRLEKFSESGFVMAPFSPHKNAFILRPDHHARIELSNISITESPWAEKQDGKQDDRLKHMALVERGVEAIRSDQLKKVVLARKIAFSFNQDPSYVFEYLLQKHPGAFCYLWYHPSVGFWLGASPELLVSLKKDSLRTYSLAGTLSYDEGGQPRWGAKEKEEQELVTGYILNKLSELSIQAHASPPESILAGKLWHLRSVISARASKDSLGNVLRALHPTPAVCGIPQKEAIRFIDKYEGFDRKFYSGYLGELNMGEASESELYVNLRCMEWTKNMASVYVGGGITAQSVPLDEWRETEAKSKTILSALFNYNK